MKKGVSMSLEVIVVAALSLIVLAIMIAIFQDKIIDFNQAADKCGKMGDACVPEANCAEFERSPNECPAGEVCCMNACVADEGTCQAPCLPPSACVKKCPAGKTRLFRTGCSRDEVCCK